MPDGPYKRYRHKQTEVLARQVTEKKVITVDDFDKEIVLYPGDWEIIRLKDGTHYGNVKGSFEENFEEVE